jgi:hypothetical protein
MKYLSEIQAAQAEPEKLERLYQISRNTNEEAEFRADLLDLHEQDPANVIFTTWYYRFQHNPLSKAGRRIHWELAALLGVITGLIIWAISGPDLMLKDHIPYFALFWAPIATIFALVFLTFVSRQHYRLGLFVAIVLAAAVSYVLFITNIQTHSWNYNAYLDLMAIHLPLLCWIGLGITVMGLKSTPNNRFAFLIKSIEVAITAGLYLIFGVVFGLITMQMFYALNINLPDSIQRLIVLGGFGLLPVLAVATMYDPTVAPKDQDFSQGLSKFVATMMRLLLPLTLVILVIYIFVIPFNFLVPFKERDVLIIYNVMLFAIIGLLIGVTPLRVEELSPKLQTVLRNGILALVILALLVSLYALSAIAYRTIVGDFTVNRTAIIGWNTINIAILGAILVTQVRRGLEGWAERLQKVFSRATVAYVIWDIFLIIALPLLFR